MKFVYINRSCMLYYDMLAHALHDTITTHRSTWRRAAVVLRAERVELSSFSARADRALRTMVARRCAADAHALAQQLGRRSMSAVLSRSTILDALASRTGWTRLNADQVTCSFGGRRAVIRVPATLTAEQLAMLLARTEVRVLLGDAGFGLVRDLQTLADCELQRLFARS